MTGAAPIAVIAAGGTGGHMFPAEALAQELRRRGWRIVLMTDKRGARFAKSFPADRTRLTDAATVSGGGMKQKAAAARVILKGVSQAVRDLKRLEPQAVIGFGGYPSVPAMAAATRLRLPRYIHEQNAVLGRVNRLFAPWVDGVAAGLPAMGRMPKRARPKTRFVGNPVRDAVAAVSGQPYQAAAANGPIELLIFGGSQGASIFSNVVPGAIAALPEDVKQRLRVVQQCRKDDLEEVERAYAAAQIKAEIAPFFSDLAARMAKADLVIARSGASTISELAAIGRPSILTPFAAAMDDHQTANARVLADVDAAVLIPERALTSDVLAAQLETLFADSVRLQRMAAAATTVARPRAAQEFADWIEGVSASQSPEPEPLQETAA